MGRPVAGIVSALLALPDSETRQVLNPLSKTAPEILSSSIYHDSTSSYIWR